MAKLTLKQKENIKALFDTGNYSKNGLAKKYKVDEKTVRRIIGKEPPKHKDLVEKAVEVEVRKKAELKPSELRAVEKVVISRVNTMEIDNELMKENRVIAKILQETITASKEEIDLTNIKAVSGTLKDIEAIANPQANKTDVTVNTQVNNTNNLSIEDFYET